MTEQDSTVQVAVEVEEQPGDVALSARAVESLVGQCAWVFDAGQSWSDVPRGQCSVVAAARDGSRIGLTLAMPADVASAAGFALDRASAAGVGFTAIDRDDDTVHELVLMTVHGVEGAEHG